MAVPNAPTAALTSWLTPVRALIIAIVAAAVLLLLQLRFYWGGESYYNYGWAVPFLAAYLFLRRGEDAPPLRTDPSRSLLITSAVLGGLLVLALFPLQMLFEVSPFWRRPLLLQAFLLIGLSVLALYLIGGWRTVRHYGFPLVFLLTMVPWPLREETLIIQGLTARVIEGTVAVLRFAQYTAEVRGTVIEIGGTTVGVDEACSGIRSLQSLGMVALFLSDFFRMSWPRRFGLFAFTFVSILFFNVIRSTSLTLIVVHAGHDAYTFWHDWVGIITFVGNLLIVYLVAELIKGAPRMRPKAASPPVAVGFPVSRLAYLPALVWGTLAVLVGTTKEGWFRYHEARAEPLPSWRIEWPSPDRMVMRFVDIPDGVANILSFDFGERAQFALPGREGVDVYWYGYTGERPVASVSSYGHSPLVCMQAIGGIFVAERQPLRLQRGPIILNLNHYLFDVPHPATGRPERVNVFWVVYENRNMGISPEELEHQRFDVLLRLIRAGRRDFSRQVLLVTVANVQSPDRAREVARSLLEEIIVPDTEDR